MWYLSPDLQDPSRPRVFQIGFNRCGTKSLAIFFHLNGYRAAHWQKGRLAEGIELARREGRPPLHYVGGFDVYTDMERVAQRTYLRTRLYRRLLPHLDPAERRRPLYAFKHFRLLDRQYPGSKFILNVRDVDHWIESRLRFEADDGGDYRFCVHGERRHEDDAALAECWRREWGSHLEDVRSYFAGRSGDLVVFDVEEDDPERLVEFFSGTRFELDASRWPWINRTRRAGDGGAGGLHRLRWRLDAWAHRTRRSLGVG